MMSLEKVIRSVQASVRKELNDEWSASRPEDTIYLELETAAQRREYLQSKVETAVEEQLDRIARALLPYVLEDGELARTLDERARKAEAAWLRRSR